MKTTDLNLSDMVKLSTPECAEISGGKCITGSDGSIIEVTRTVDSNGHVTITAVRNPFCRIGGK